jgi:NACHT N-terminal Helical domain 7
MEKDLSFESACQIIKGEYPELANDIDKFSSIVFIAGTTMAAIPIAAAVGPTILTPAAIVLTAVGTLSNLLGVKNEIFAISESIIAKVTNKRDKDTLKMFERMQQAYTSTCYTSFFEALYSDKELAPLLKRIKMTGEEKRTTVMYAVKDLLGKSNAQTSDTEKSWLEFVIDLPQPGDTFETQSKLLLPLYQGLVNRIRNFFELVIVKKQVEQSGGLEKIEETLRKVPEKALKYFKAQYYGLAMKYPEFAIWINLQLSERDSTKVQEEMGEYSRKFAELAENGQRTIDIGFKHLEKIINSYSSANRTKTN